MQSHSVLGLAAIVVAVVVAPINVASAPPSRVSPTAMLRSESALSLGAPNAGRLVRGDRLDGSEHIRVVPAWSHQDFRWGLPELIGMLRGAASAVNDKHGPCIMSVGDLSSRSGGTLRKHKSHQSGRDADISFYMTDGRGKPMYHSTFVEFDADGRAPKLPEARFDDTRNWALVEALLRDRNARVQNIFVSNALRKRLLEEAERQGAGRSIRLEAARVMSLPNGAAPHDDHFHVRIGCPTSQGNACELWPRAPSSAADSDSTKAEPTTRGKRRRGGS